MSKSSLDAQDCILGERFQAFSLPEERTRYLPKVPKVRVTRSDEVVVSLLVTNLYYSCSVTIPKHLGIVYSRGPTKRGFSVENRDSTTILKWYKYRLQDDAIEWVAVDPLTHFWKCFQAIVI